MDLSFLGGSGFSSKPTTPTGTVPTFPPMGSPSRPPPSPQHAGGWQPHAGASFPSWQPGAASGGGWLPQGPGPAPQPKPSPSHASMPHASPQNRPNYNVSFSVMGGGSPSAGVKAQPGVGEMTILKNILYMCIYIHTVYILCEKEKCIYVCVYIYTLSFLQKGLGCLSQKNSVLTKYRLTVQG